MQWQKDACWYRTSLQHSLNLRASMKPIAILPRTCSHILPRQSRYSHLGSSDTSNKGRKQQKLTAGLERPELSYTWKILPIALRKYIHTKISDSSSIAAKVTSCDITLWATCELIGCPMKIMRFLNNTVERSSSPPGVITAGMMGGFPFLASITPLLIKERSWSTCS